MTREARGYVTAATPDAVPGYVLSRFADVYGRAVSLAYPGVRSEPEGDDGTAYVSVTKLEASVNYRLVAEGLAYPTFYSRLYWGVSDKRWRACTSSQSCDGKAPARTNTGRTRSVGNDAATVAARDGGLGVWSQDAMPPGFDLTAVSQLTDDLVLLPKLFRRLAEFLVDAGEVVTAGDLAGFEDFLATHDDDGLYTVPRGQYTTLDTLIERRGVHLRLTLPPEQIVFIER